MKTNTTDTPRTDACPRCNGNRMPFKEGDGKVIYYTCGSYGVPAARFYQSDLCDAHQELAASKAEVEKLKGQLIRAVEIADEFWNNQKQAVLVYHHELVDELDQLEATLNPTNK